MVGLHEQLEDVRQHVRRNTNPVIAHSQYDVAFFCTCRNPYVSVCLSVFGRVGQQVADELSHAHRVGIHQQRFVRKRQLQPVSLNFNERLDRLHCAGDHRRQLHRFSAQLDLAPHHSGHIQQIIDEPHEMMDLPLHHGPGLLDRRCIDPWHLQDFKRVPDGRQGIA